MGAGSIATGPASQAAFVGIIDVVARRTGDRARQYQSEWLVQMVPSAARRLWWDGVLAPMLGSLLAVDKYEGGDARHFYMSSRLSKVVHTISS